MPVVETAILVGRALIPAAIQSVRRALSQPSRISVVRKVAKKYGVGSREWAAIARKFPKAAARYERRPGALTAGPIVPFPPGGRSRGGARRVPPRTAAPPKVPVPRVGPISRLPGRLLGRGAAVTPAVAAALIVGDYVAEYGKKLYQEYMGLEGPEPELIPKPELGGELQGRPYAIGPYRGGGPPILSRTPPLYPTDILPRGSPPLRLPSPPRVPTVDPGGLLQRASSYALSNTATLAALSALLLPKKVPTTRVRVAGAESLGQPVSPVPEAPLAPGLTTGGLTPLESALIQSLQGEAKQQAPVPKESLAERCKARAKRMRKKKGPRKLRTICYSGSYRETRTGLRKQKRRRVPCK